MLLELRPHQTKASEKLDNGKVLWGGTGSGKSIVAADYYMKREIPRDVVVITTAKKRDDLDWQRDFAGYGIGRDRNGTVGGVLRVDSWNNIGNYTDVRDAFFIFDEQRIVGSGAWSKSFLTIAKNNRWILLSATPGDTWLDYIPIFIANGFYKNRTDFCRQHVIWSPFSKFPKVERYTEVGTLVKLRNSILVEMPYLRHTTRHVKHIKVDYDKELFDKAVKERWNPYEDQPMRDVSELFRVMRKIANSDPSRAKTVRDLLNDHPRLIVFYNFNYELEQLKTIAADILSEESMKTFAVAEWNGHKHQPIPETDGWLYLVQYVAGAEGWNCISTNATCFYSLTYSYKNFHQAMGRTDRLNTPFLDQYYYVFVSNSLIDRAVLASLKAKQSFNEARFAKTL